MDVRVICFVRRAGRIAGEGGSAVDAAPPPFELDRTLSLFGVEGLIHFGSSLLGRFVLSLGGLSDLFLRCYI
jgi:hypothetical protein